MRLQFVLETAITAAQDAAIRTGLCICFPPDREIFSRTRAWHDSHPAWSVLVEHDDSVVAHAGVVERQVLVGQERVWIAGVQNAFVLPEHCGLGLFRRIMAAVWKKQNAAVLSSACCSAHRRSGRSMPGRAGACWMTEA